METPTLRPPRRFPTSTVRWAAAAVLGALVVVFILAILRAERAGEAGKTQLLRAEKDLLAQHIQPAQQDLRRAEGDFRSMRSDLHGFGVGQMMAVARVLPLVRLQVRAADTFADVGISLSQAGIPLTDAVNTIQSSSGTPTPLSGALDKLRLAQTSLHKGVLALNDASVRVKQLDTYRLFGPLDRAERQLSTRLVHVDANANSAEQGLAALITFIGGGGPRRYLVLSQNPDEVRPTGGFIGSYGVLVADAGHVHLERYGGSSDWYLAHPDAVVPDSQLGSPFRFYDPPLVQTLANVNAWPDWPRVSQLALKLWQQGGEQPADGVVSFTPNFLARVLAVTGPVLVPSYNETVTAGNVIARLDYYTHVLPPKPGEDRKEFLQPLAQAVMTKLLEVPASQWVKLGQAMGKAFGARELAVWSADQSVQSTLTSRSWDGTLPTGVGDFFFDGEFEYAAKNGRGLKRTFDHQVTVHSNGSALVTTTISISNTEDPNVHSNDNVVSYLTIYGPAGAVLDPSSDTPVASEPSIGDHPAYGWLQSLLPHTVTTIKVVWTVPNLGVRLTNGDWQYPLRWMNVVDNTGDVVRLSVVLPANAHWIGKPPPTDAKLNQDLVGAWTYRLG